MMTSDKPRRRVSQAPIKITDCLSGCGARVEYRTNPRVYCAPCKLEKLRASARASMEKQRRKRGITKVKGVRRECARCGKWFAPRNNVKTKRCPKCRDEWNLEKARQRVLRLARERGAREVGSMENCSRCGCEFKVTSPNNHLCAPCGQKSVKMQFPDLAEKRKAYKRRWLDDNRHLEREYQKRCRRKRKQDPAFTINERMSASVRQSLILGKQGWRWESLVGYTLADLMAHLEAQFLPGMSWENRGEWHIDHIRPLCSFDFQTPDDPQFREAWALTNLQPLWAVDNLRKGGRWAA